MAQPPAFLDAPVQVVRAAMLADTNRTLAQRWGVHESTVSRWRARLGLPTRKGQGQAPTRRAQIVTALTPHPAGLRFSELQRTQQNITTQALATSLWHATRAGIVEKQAGRWRLVHGAPGGNC